MACGRAVIGTSAGGTREYIVHGDSGIIIPPRDTDAIVESLLSILSNDAERQRLAVQARKRVLEKFQRKEIARQTVELYELARQRFCPDSGMYLKDSSSFMTDAELIMYSFDKMLYDLLYQESIAFRFRHWAKLGMRRPRLLGAKIVLRFAQKFCSVFLAKHEPSSAALAKFEEEIKDKQKRAMLADRQLVSSGSGSASKR